MKKGLTEEKLIHEIFILDANLTEIFNEYNRNEKISNMIDEMLAELNMEKLSPLVINEAVDLSAPGWTFIQPITTSHISAHYFIETNKPSHLHFDLYSCKPFNWSTALQIIDKYFKIDDWSANFIKRDTYTRSIIEIKGNKLDIALNHILE